MPKLLIKPRGWPCSLERCPPGHFLLDYEDINVKTRLLCFKSEYRSDNGKIEIYNEAGEYLSATNEAIVQPVYPEWEDDDD